MSNGRLGDYQPTLPNRIITTARGPQGPLQSPIRIPDQKESAEQLLHRLTRLTEELPIKMARAFREVYTEEGRDAQDFVKTNDTGTGVTSVAFGVESTIINFTVQQNFEGEMRAIGVSVSPPGNFSDIQWTLRINSTLRHPGFNSVVFAESTLATPLWFKSELLEGRKIELLAKNTAAAGSILVSAVLLGYTAYKADWKKWGTAPVSGIG